MDKTFCGTFVLRYLIPFCCCCSIFTVGQAAVVFSDVSSTTGVDDATYSGATNHTLGVCWIDYDNDGFPDLFATNGFNRKPHLYHNDGDGTFTNVDILLPNLDQIEQAGCIFGDYDNDGDSDIFIPTHHENFNLNSANPNDGPPSYLLRNMWVENGNRTISGQPLFNEVAAQAGVDGIVAVPLGNDYLARSSMTGGWLDYNRDGCIDLYVGQMILESNANPSNEDTLYRNNCNGSFQDVTSQAGIDSSNVQNPYRPALAFVGAHLNGDMWPDMLVVNVHEPAPHFEDYIYINNGNGTFSETAGQQPGIGDDAGSGMGVDVADIDLNGTWDVYITDVFNTGNDQRPLGNVLYLGNGDGSFQENIAPAAGVQSAFSWGTNFLDADQDGYEDLLVGTSRMEFYVNAGNGTFNQLNTLPRGQNVRGTAVADYDRDGDLDIAVAQQGGTILLLRNDSTGAGHWLQLKLVGVASNRDAIGALVTVQANNKTMMRQIKGGSSAHSQDMLILHFGVGNATTIDSIRIQWPNGGEDSMSNVTADRCIHVVEGSANPNNLCAGGGGQPPPPPPPPGDNLQISSVTPNELSIGSTVDVTLIGAGFEAGTEVVMCKNGGIVVNSVTFVDANTLIARITVDANDPRSCGARVINPDGERFTSLNAITIVEGDPGDPPPSDDPLNISSVAPNTLAAGSSVELTVTGTGFDSGATVLVCNNGGVNTELVTLVDSTTLLVQVSVDASKIPGSCGIRVDNPDSERAIFRNAITITEGDPGDPGDELSLTGVSPTVLSAGTSAQVTLSGTGFSSDDDVQICANGGVNIDLVTFVDTNTLLVDVSIDANKSGSCGARVIKANGERVTLLRVLEIQ